MIRQRSTHSASTGQATPREPDGKEAKQFAEAQPSTSSTPPPVVPSSSSRWYQRLGQSLLAMPGATRRGATMVVSSLREDPHTVLSYTAKGAAIGAVGGAAAGVGAVGAIQLHEGINKVLTHAKDFPSCTAKRFRGGDIPSVSVFCSNDQEEFALWKAVKADKSGTQGLPLFAQVVTTGAMLGAGVGAVCGIRQVNANTRFITNLSVHLAQSKGFCTAAEEQMGRKQYGSAIESLDKALEKNKIILAVLTQAKKLPQQQQQVKSAMADIYALYATCFTQSDRPNLSQARACTAKSDSIRASLDYSLMTADASSSSNLSGLGRSSS
ncbi:hypothetical protein BH10PSE19_BH10PSE19_20320 [soil metagenome]